MVEKNIQTEKESLNDKDIEIQEEKAPKKRIRKNRRQRRLKDEIESSLISIHTIATEKDIEELSLKNISVEKLPLIFISDAAIRHLEVKVGDVIKIKRKNDIIGDIYYYRRVISDD